VAASSAIRLASQVPFRALVRARVSGARVPFNSSEVVMNVETLERRRLLSVTVSQGYPGFYEVHGDASADTIAISVSMAWGTFTLDGQQYGGVEYIAVQGYGGDDAITLSASDGFGYIAAGITGGDGSDTITLNFDGAIWGGEGSDQINLRDSFRGEAYGGGGDDTIVVQGDTIDAEINGGDGNDLIDARGNNYRVVLRGGNGDDTLYGSAHDDQLYGDGGTDVLSGGGGSDSLFE
jgi:Ca2+-binding RTX toxin-like protein